MADKVKVLGALITRVEEGAAEGDQFSASIDDSESTADTKRELVRYVQFFSIINESRKRHINSYVRA